MGAGKKVGIGIGAVIAAIAALVGIGGYQTDTPQPTITQPSVQQENKCDSSYPDFCISPNSPDLDCGEIQYRNFRVLPPDRHGFDRDNDGVGCEE